MRRLFCSFWRAVGKGRINSKAHLLRIGHGKVVEDGITFRAGRLLAVSALLVGKTHLHRLKLDRLGPDDLVGGGDHGPERNRGRGLGPTRLPSPEAVRAYCRCLY